MGIIIVVMAGERDCGEDGEKMKKLRGVCIISSYMGHYVVILPHNTTAFPLSTYPSRKSRLSIRATYTR